MGQPRNPKYDTAAQMYDKGMSLQELAAFYGMSRQAMWKIIKRRTTLRPQKRYADENHFFRGTSNRYGSRRARWLVNRAIQRGALVKNPCEVCGNTESEAHHCDYNKPLEVTWLCDNHHFEWHKHHKPIPLAKDFKKMTSHEIASKAGKASCEKRWGKIT